MGSSNWWHKSWCVTCGGPTTGSATFERRETEREKASSLGWPRGTHERSQREERERERESEGERSDWPKFKWPQGWGEDGREKKKKKEKKRMFVHVSNSSWTV